MTTLKLYEAWDEVDRAAQRVLTALPSQMTEAAERLDQSRLAFRAELQAFTRAKLSGRKA